MAQAQRSAEIRKPLTVQKSAIVRKRGVSGAVPGADMPFVDRAAAMANDDAKAPDPTTPLFPKAAEADSPEPAQDAARSMAAWWTSLASIPKAMLAATVSSAR